jgi:His-Xaa-Ser system radical SAM maturase HxsC
MTGFAALITTAVTAAAIPSISSINKIEFDGLSEGDIVRVDVDGAIQILWEADSCQNVLYLNDHCNSACIMCPQKVEGVHESYHSAMAQVLTLAPASKQVSNIGITGGEPTLFVENLIDILGRCRDKFPNAGVSLLTNGKTLSDFNTAKQIAFTNPNIIFCIPLYAPSSCEHDEIVGSPGSFDLTMKGLYNLARLQKPVEIRIVILQKNYHRIADLAEYIYRNLPFASHVALMGMECSGVAADNLAKVWIDPYEYQQELKACALDFHRRAMNVSVYNLPYCLLPSELWRFARNSISEWKKTYLAQCERCDKRDECPGTFSTSVLQSSFINPIVT